MNLVRAFKDFITDDEKKILNDWSLSNYCNDYFIDPKMDSNGLERTKLTTRFATPLISGNILISSNSNFTYPKISYFIQQRIVNTFGFKNYGISPVGKDGIITEVSFENGTVHPHIDPEWFPNTYTVHCNLITQKPDSGGVTYIQGSPWDINENDLLMYIVSKAEHSVNKIVGKKERVLWVFSFMLNIEDIKNNFYD
jgi:NADPH-dependent 7-cyano-7-deazaguanine reductase QueF